MEEQIEKIGSWAKEANESIFNVRDLAVVLMENALIEQAIENHKMMGKKNKNKNMSTINQANG